MAVWPPGCSVTQVVKSYTFPSCRWTCWKSLLSDRLTTALAETELQLTKMSLKSPQNHQLAAFFRHSHRKRSWSDPQKSIKSNTHRMFCTFFEQFWRPGCRSRWSESSTFIRILNTTSAYWSPSGLAPGRLTETPSTHESAPTKYKRRNDCAF